MIRRASKVVIAGAVLLGVAGLGGCATKNFVNEQVAPLSAQLTAQDAKLSGVDATAREALGRADAAGKLAEGKFLYSMVMSDDSLKFPPAKATLSPEAQARLDTFIEKLKTDNRNVYVEVQGHIDASEAKQGGYRLGEQRAEAVRRYLNQHGVALNRIGVISYGADAPAAPSSDRAGRQANRRVVLVVLV
ncbi:MAG TPA: OmpA family protein [Phenylobacterium sp.]|nr:OmpA family protein [Phenylobacterium sp.]